MRLREATKCLKHNGGARSEGAVPEAAAHPGLGEAPREMPTTAHLTPRTSSPLPPALVLQGPQSPAGMVRTTDSSSAAYVRLPAATGARPRRWGQPGAAVRAGGSGRSRQPVPEGRGASPGSPRALAGRSRRARRRGPRPRPPPATPRRAPFTPGGH